MLRITFFAAAALICSTQAYAVMYLARPYEPNMARWLTRDPIGERGGLNLYGFVRNDPIDTFDAFGLTAHLAPANDIIVNASSYEVNISGDWVEIALYTPGRGTAYAYPWSYSQEADVLQHVPSGTTASISEPSGAHILKPGHNSAGDWAAGLTRIVDADFLTGAAVPVYTDSSCCKLMKHWAKPTRWTHILPISLTVYDCKNKRAVYYVHGNEYP